ncbi:GAF domain-containing protein [Sporosarcina sp. CAU 1771]
MEFEPLFNFLFEVVPWLTIALLCCLLVIFLLICIKIHKGSATLSLWGLKFESNKAVATIQSQFSELNKQSHLKTQVIKLLNQSMVTHSDYGSMSDEEFHEKVKRFYDFFLPGIIGLITKEVANLHRVAVFYKVDYNNLKILYGAGYSPEGVEKLRLSLTNSKAGYSYINGKEYYNPDITKDASYERNPKSSREYKSLLCIPIKYNSKTIGILNVDGLLSNSFDRDDIDYITYFSNSISSILNKEINYLSSLNEEEAFYYEKEKSG